jgi:hypothetical protein
MTGLDISKSRGGRHRTLPWRRNGGALQTLAIIAAELAMKERQHKRSGHAKDISK